MPWKEQAVMDAREAFIKEYLEGSNSFQYLCESYGVSTKTGYKWRQRFMEGGYPALADMSRRPHRHSKQLTEDELCNVIKLKQTFPHFGPKKICELYNRAHKKDLSLSSVERILSKSGYTQKRKKRKINSLAHDAIILEAKKANDIWTIDFKGHWLGRGGGKCEPFTVVDQYSRYILYCLPLAQSNTDHVMSVFIELFKKYGLPKIIKSDNGSPFAHGLSPRGITRLSNWLMSLGIHIHRIEPGKPYQNGKHERMHKDMKQIIQKGPRLSLKEYSAALNLFKIEYNEQRPHEGIDMKFPCELYQKSERKYLLPSKDIIYPKDLQVRRVTRHGQIGYEGNKYTISGTLTGYLIGIKDEDMTASVYFCDEQLGELDLELKQFVPNNHALQLHGANL